VFSPPVSIPLTLYPAGLLVYIHTSTTNPFALTLVFNSRTVTCVLHCPSPLLVQLLLLSESVNAAGKVDAISYTAIFWKQDAW